MGHLYHILPFSGKRSEVVEESRLKLSIAGQIQVKRQFQTENKYEERIVLVEVERVMGKANRHLGGSAGDRDKTGE